MVSWRYGSTAESPAVHAERVADMLRHGEGVSRMRCLRLLTLSLALGGSLTLAACGVHPFGEASTPPTEAMCFGPRPVASVLPIGGSISFSVTIVRDAHTYTYAYSIPKSAFGGSPAAMKSGDLVGFCAQTVHAGGQSTTTITDFTDQGQPAAAGMPQSGG